MRALHEYKLLQITKKLVFELIIYNTYRFFEDFNINKKKNFILPCGFMAKY